MPHHHLTEIGKYQVEELLGEGAMGVVYRALDPVLNRRVAIKVMSDALAQDGELRERFLREARLAGSLQHPNVITVYDFGEVEGHPYIAMEYVEGADLEELLRKNVPLSIDAALDLIIGLLQGLAYAHKHGIVHRDIKPANVRVDEEGNARIMDFGVAHLASSKLTRTGMMMGTPSYMAPEQITGDEVTPGTDIFAVGVVLYELLTRTRPFQADTLHAIMYNILTVTPPALDKVLPGLPAALNTVTMRALQKEPANRYASALEMANELSLVRASLANQPSEPRTLSLRASIETALADRRAARRRAERRWRAILGGSIVLAFAALAGITFWSHFSIVAGPPGATPITRAPAASNEGASSPARTDTAVDAGTRTASVAGSGAAQAGQRPPLAPVRSGVHPTAPPAGPSQPALDSSLALTRRVQLAAESARQRASIAGANASQLAAGDAHARSAEDLIRQHKLAEAAGEFSLAAVAWTDAERSARLAAVAAATPVTVQSGATAAPQPVHPAPSPVRVAPSAPAPDPTVEIAAIIAAYAKAIDARDLAQLRRIHPGMTDEERRGFQDFFANTRSLHASLSVVTLQADSLAADAQIAGTYEYVTTTGRSERQPVSFRALLRRDSGGWKLVTLK